MKTHYVVLFILLHFICSAQTSSKSIDFKYETSIMKGNGKTQEFTEGGHIIWDRNNKMLKIYVGGERYIPFIGGLCYFYEEASFLKDEYGKAIGFYMDCKNSRGEKTEFYISNGKILADFSNGISMLFFLEQ